MKKTAKCALLLLLFLATASCASSPSWSGTETAAGEFVWAPSPGWRFYVNAVLLGGMFVLFATYLVQDIRNRKKGETGSIGCFSFLLVFSAIALFSNIRDVVWYESFTISRSGISRSYYTRASIFPGLRRTETIEWSGVRQVAYRPYLGLEHNEPTTITDPLSGRKYRRIGSSESGTEGRGISFCRDAHVCAPVEEGRDITLIVERQDFGRFPPIDWVLGSDEFTISPGEESRLKAAIRRFVPATLQAEMTPETRAYFQG